MFLKKDGILECHFQHGANAVSRHDLMNATCFPMFIKEVYLEKAIHLHSHSSWLEQGHRFTHLRVLCITCKTKNQMVCLWHQLTLANWIILTNQTLTIGIAISQWNSMEYNMEWVISKNFFKKQDILNLNWIVNWLL